MDQKSQSLMFTYSTPPHFRCQIFLPSDLQSLFCLQFLVCQFLVSFKYLHWFYSIHSDFLFPCSFVYILFVKSQHHCIKLIMACYTLKLWTPVTIYNCQLFTGVNTIDWCTLKQMATTDFYIIVWKLWKNIVLCVYTCNWNSFCCLGIFHRPGPLMY